MGEEAWTQGQSVPLMRVQVPWQVQRKWRESCETHRTRRSRRRDETHHTSLISRSQTVRLAVTLDTTRHAPRPALPDAFDCLYPIWTLDARACISRIGSALSLALRLGCLHLCHLAKAPLHSCASRLTPCLRYSSLDPSLRRLAHGRAMGTAKPTRM